MGTWEAMVSAAGIIVGYELAILFMHVDSRSRSSRNHSRRRGLRRRHSRSSRATAAAAAAAAGIICVIGAVMLFF
jgi:hypothetical protein